MAVPPPVYTPFDVLKFLPESQASGVDFCHFQFILNHVMSLRDILSPHFHESSKDQSSYIKSLTAGKKGIAFLRAEVTSFRRQYSLHTHTHARNTTRSVKRFICFPTFISKMGGIVTFLCKRLDCAARVLLENATYVNNSFTKYLTV